MHGALRSQSALEKGDLPHRERREFLFLLLAKKSHGQVNLIRLHPSGAGNTYLQGAERFFDIIRDLYGNKESNKTHSCLLDGGFVHIAFSKSSEQVSIVCRAENL